MTEDSATTGTADKPDKAKKGDKTERPTTTAEPSFSRPTLPYVIAAVIASAAMAWYFFVFVPAKLDYFVGLRFRTLAVAAGHISSKIENLASAFRAGFGAESPSCYGKDHGDVLKYLAGVLPDIRVESAAVPPTGGPSLSDCGVSGSIAWSSVVDQAAASSRRDFDDLILATGNGDVVWQRETSTPRIGNLSELLGAKDPSEGWAFSWREKATSPITKDQKNLQASAQLKPVNVGGNSSLLLVQAVTVRGNVTLPGQADGASEPTLFVAGLVVREGLLQQARRIPAAWLVPFGCAIVFLFLAIPFVKLATLTAKERFRFSDVLLMIVATVSAAGFGALLASASESTSTADRTLKALSDKIQDNLASETQDILTLGTFIRENWQHITPRKCTTLLRFFDETGTPLDCDLWAALGEEPIAAGLKRLGVKPAQPSVDLDVVVWLDGTGNQVKKWTTKQQVTSRTSHAGYQHFRDLTSGHLWTLDGGTPFTIEPLRAPTTAELAIAFAMPAEDKDVHNRYILLNVRPQSLVDALVPPGHGFAIIARDGRVLFHSDEGLSLEENFFEELGDAREARDSVAGGRLLQWSGDYHGRRHRLRMQPITVFVGCPWSIVTFQESEPQLAAAVARQAGTFRMGLVNLALLAILASLFAGFSRYKHRRSRDLMQMMIADPRSESAARRVRFLVGVVVIEILLWLSTFAFPFSLVPPNLVYLLFAALPLLALLVTFLVRPWGASGKGGTRAPVLPPPAPSSSSVATWSQRLHAWFSKVVPGWELGLVVVAIGVMPAAGFTQVVRIVDHTNETQRWLELAQDHWESRQLRVAQRIHGPNYAPETTTLLETALGARTFDPDARYSYLTISSNVAKGTGSTPPSGQGIVRWLLDWDLFSSSNEPLAWTENAHPITRDGPLSMLTVGPGTGRVSYFLIVAGIAILACALAAVYWARRKLLVHPAAAPSLESVVGGVGDAEGVVVLLVGPPMAKKDRRLARVIRKKTKQEVVDRLRLLDAPLTLEVVQQYLARVDRAIAAAMLKGSKAPFWIHVSNLETQLVDPASRRLVFDLLQRLGEAPPEARRVVAVTSSVNPIAHFEEIFREERAHIYIDPVPEVALSRSVLLLSRIRRCYMPISDPKGRLQRCRAVWDHWWSYDPRQWRDTLKAELDGLAPLEPIHEELLTLWKNRDQVQFEEIVRTIRLRASAYYQLLWTTCTRNEKLVLIQLAQEGFVVEQSWDVVVPLVARGIIVERPIPAIFNRTFRDFLLDIERDSVIQEWERGEGHGLWLVSGRLIGSSLVAGLLFFLLTQDVSVQSLLPVVSGTGVFSVPLVRSLIARFSPKSGAATA